MSRTLRRLQQPPHPLVIATAVATIPMRGEKGQEVVGNNWGQGNTPVPIPLRGLGLLLLVAPAPAAGRLLLQPGRVQRPSHGVERAKERRGRLQEAGGGAAGLCVGGWMFVWSRG